MCFSSNIHVVYLPLSLIVILFLIGCGLLDGKQEININCEEHKIFNDILHISVSRGSNSYISALETDSLKEQYRIEKLREAPFYIDYENDSFYYTYSVSSQNEAFVKRTLKDGNLMDSLSLPKGSNLFKVKDSYIIYGNASSSYIYHDGELIPKNFEYFIQSIQNVEDKFYALYGNPGSLLLFGTIDTSGVFTTHDLTDIVNEIIPNFSNAYDMFYIELENRLLFTVEDYSNPPSTLFFDVNLSKNRYKSFKVGDHSNIYQSTDKRYYFFSHQLTLRLSSKLTQNLVMYDSNNQVLVNLIDLQNELGAEAYIQDMAVSGCYLYTSILLRNTTNFSLTPKIFKYNLQSRKIEQIKEIETSQDSQSLIYSTTISSNPKSNKGLK